MKKILAVLLAAILILTGGLLAYALAEAPAVPAAGPTVDVTGLVIAVLLAAFEFLMARFARVLIPPAKAWLEAQTTEKERGLLWNAVCELVDAAEQIIKGPAMGERRKAYVEAGLRQRGLSVDSDMIEAAVKRMNDGFMSTMATAFKVTPEDFGGTAEQGGTVHEISPEQLAAVTELLEKLEKERADSPFLVPACTKDYCELDENGNEIPEEPQSANE